MLGQEVENYVKSEIKFRQEVVYNNSNRKENFQLALSNRQNSWIKLASGVLIKDDDNGREKLKSIGLSQEEIDTYTLDGLAKNFILFNGTSYLPDGWTKLQNRGGFSRDSFLIGGSYSKSDFGIVPMPGIVGFDVKSLNRGSIKKATIKFKLHSKQQFNIFELLYLRLGYTVVVEWGNNIYYGPEEITSDTDSPSLTSDPKLIEVRETYIDSQDGFFSSKTISSEKPTFLDVLNSIEKYRGKYNANYDGFLGKVTNFEWTIDELGSYDVTLNLVSLGDVIESLKVNIPINQRFVNFLEKIKTKEEETVKNQVSAMLYAHRYTNQNPTANPVYINGADTNQVGNLMDSLSPLTSKKTIVKFYCGPARIWRTGTRYFDYPKKLVFTKEYTQDQRSNGYPDKDSNNARWHYVKNAIKAWGKPFTLSGNVDRNNKEAQYNKFADENFKDIYTYQLWSYDEVELANPAQNLATVDGFKTNQSDPNYYLRLGALMKWVQQNVIPIVKSENGDSDDFSPILNLNCDPNYYEAAMYTLPNQISLDPRVCIVRNDSFYQYPSLGSSSGGNFKVYKGLLPFREDEFEVEQIPDYNPQTKELSEPINLNRAYIQNIYLNHSFIESCLGTNDEGDINLYDFFSQICKGINRALGGINRLEPIIDETRNLLTIADLTPIPGQVLQFPNPPYKLNLFGFSPEEGSGNFVRKFDIKTTITPEYASMITIGSTANGYVKGTNGTAFSKWNKGLEDKFKPLIESPTPLSTTSLSDLEGEEAEAFLLNLVLPNEAATIYWQAFLYSGNYKFGYSTNLQSKYDNPAISRNLDVVTEFYKFALAYKTLESNDDSVAGGIGFIPFKLGFTLSGLSGIKIYNTLHINSQFLPKAYGDTLDFIITGVDHSIKNNDWETKIETLVQPKSSTETSVVKDYEYIFKNLSPSLASLFTFDLFPPSTSGTNTNPKTYANVAIAREQHPDLGKGTLGTKGRSHTDLPPDGLTYEQIQYKLASAKRNIDNSSYYPSIQSSSAYKNLLERMISIASSYVGQSEINENIGWYDPLYQEKFEKATVKWSPGGQWCNYFVNLIWREAYTTGNALIGPNSNASIKNDWSTLLKDGGWSRMSASCFRAGKGSTLGKHQQFFPNNVRTLSQVRTSPKKYFVVPGAFVIFSISHIGLVTSIQAKNGKYTTFTTIEGNTSTGDPRDGGGTEVKTYNFSSTTATHFINPPTSLIKGFS